jgi:hypothetical protein
MQPKGFIGSGDRSNAHYSEPKARILERASELRDVTVVGKEQSGKTVIWSSLPDQQTEQLFTEAFPALAEG